MGLIIHCFSDNYRVLFAVIFYAYIGTCAPVDGKFGVQKWSFLFIVMAYGVHCK